MARFRRSRRQAVLSLPHLDGEESDTRAGVVAEGLSTAHRFGLTVPSARVLGTSAFHHAVTHLLPPGHDPASLLRVIHRPRGVEQAARALERLQSLEFDAELDEQVSEILSGLGQAPLGITLVASPSPDDYDLCRAAGLLGSRFALRKGTAVAQAIREIWSQAVREGTLLYLRHRRQKNFSMAIVAYATPEIRATGRLLTRAPRSSSDGPTSLIATRRGLALGRHPAMGCETLRLGDDGRVLSRSPATRETAWTVHRDGIVEAPVPRPTDPILDAKTLEAVFEIGRTLAPRGSYDVEFAVDAQGRVTVTGLQAFGSGDRPAGAIAATRFGRLIVGDTGANPLTALSQSVVAELAKQRERRVLALGGVSASRAPPLYHVQGLVYENISALVASNQRGQLDALTLVELAGAQADRIALRSNIPDRTLARIGLESSRLGNDLRKLREAVDRFDREAEQQRRWLAELDLGILPDDALKTTLREGREFFALTARLLLDVATPLASAQSMLLSLLARRRRQAPRQAAVSIAAGIGDLETAKVGIAFGHVVEIARREPAVVEWLRSASADEWRNLPTGATRRAFGQFLEGFGDRSIEDLELTTPRWREEPAFLLRALRAGVRGPWFPPDAVLSRARAAADRELAIIESQLSFVELRLLRDLTSRAREVVRLAARLRVRLGHASAMFRTIVRDVDRRLRRIDPSLQRGSAFHCTFDELVVAVGRDRDDLGPLVRARTSEWQSFRASEELLAAFAGNPPRMNPPLEDPMSLSGIGASPGVAEGAARRVEASGSGLEDFVPGDVLLLPVLETGHAPLLQLAGGVIAEMGGYWSDGVIVARELGVPAVVAASGALANIAPGESVRIDGTRGTIERLV